VACCANATERLNVHLTAIDNMNADFNEQGFVALPGFLNGQELAKVRANLDRFIREVVPGMPKEHVFYEDKDDPTSLKQLQKLADNDPFFRELMFGGRFEQLARDLLRDEVVGVNLQYFCKPPGIGKPTPPHQDGYYFMLDPCEAITMWLALDHVDEENGCVRYLPGSHRHGMRQHNRTSTLGFSQGIADYGRDGEAEDEVAIHAAPGDLLAHHALTIHRADGNHSPTRPRPALGLVYYAARAKEDKAAKAAYQQKLETDLAAQGKI